MSINSTQVKLHLVAWYDGGCEIEKFVVQYRARGQEEWVLVSNNILKEQLSITIRDLIPATAYELQVAAQNHVGRTDMRYRFYTLDSEGKQVGVGHSMFDQSMGDMDDLDYTDPQNPTARRGEESSLRTSMMLLRHMLNSPFTLMLALGLFVILFVMLVFHRFTFNSQGSTSSLGTLNSSLNKSPARGNGNGNGNGTGNGYGNDHRRDSDPSQVNGGGGGGMLGMDGGSDAPLSSGSLQDTPQRSMNDTAAYQRSTFAGNNSGNNYASATAGNPLSPFSAPPPSSCHVGPNLYGQLGPNQYASAHRNLGDGLTDEQCLMQMLMLNAQHQQQNSHLSESEQQSPMGLGEPMNPSYVTAALTTLARNKRLQNGSQPMSYSTYTSGAMNAATLGRAQQQFTANFPSKSK